MSVDTIKISLPLGFAVPEGKSLTLKISGNKLEWACDGEEKDPIELTANVSKVTIYG